MADHDVSRKAACKPSSSKAGGGWCHRCANAARVAYQRLGVNLQTATPAAQAVVGAVGRLLQDTEVRDHVARLAKVYVQHDALDTIERLLLD